MGHRWAGHTLRGVLYQEVGVTGFEVDRAGSEVGVASVEVGKEMVGLGHQHEEVGGAVRSADLGAKVALEGTGRDADLEEMGGADTLPPGTVQWDPVPVEGRRGRQEVGDSQLTGSLALIVSSVQCPRGA